jgi:hypothetical protein
LAIINDSTIAIGNDNDFGQTSPLADGIATGNLSHLITYRMSGDKKYRIMYHLFYRYHHNHLIYYLQLQV